jgi:predicted O-linked N-acetylglucosamine transferase (SPINDLY family)
MADLPIQPAFEHAVAHHRAGRLSDAEATCRQILAQFPGHAETLHFLGILCQQSGRPGEAERFIRRAVDLVPDHSGYLANLGVILATQGRSAEAIEALRRSLALRSDHAPTRNHLAAALLLESQFDQATAEAQTAVTLKPDYVDAHLTLGNALLAREKTDAAIACYRRAVTINPRSAPALNALALALRKQLALPEAVGALRAAVTADPNHLESLNNLGICLAELRNYDQAIDVFRRAGELRPDAAEVWSNLAGALQDTGQLSEAIELFRRAQSIKPNRKTADTLLLSLHYHPDTEPAALLAEHRQWACEFAEPLAGFIQPHSNDRAPDRRLRIGYVSPDFRDHPVGGCFLPVVSKHDRKGFEIFCYSALDERDEITARIQGHADVWRDVARLSEEELAGQIRADRIDILVDLASHTRENRLLTFARKPAPIQVSWLGWPGTTGLETIDYRLSDPYLDPPEQAELPYTERTIRLPDSFWCYDPTTHQPVVEVSELPAIRRGYVTFGSISIFTKINPPLLDLWARVLASVEHSRLVLRVPRGKAREWLLDHLSHQGIDPSCIGFVERLARKQYWRLFDGIDITLDTLPYNGHTSTLDSLWMGVPVVTQAGRSPVGRAGVSILSNLALTEFVAHSPDDYVRIAAELARDVPRLTALRRSLRQRLQASPITDAPRFARNLEAIYRQMWIEWIGR